MVLRTGCGSLGAGGKEDYENDSFVMLWSCVLSFLFSVVVVVVVVMDRTVQ